MSFILLEYIFLGIVFLTVFYFSVKEKRSRGILVVKNLRHMCKSDIEEKIYDELHIRGLYASPSVQCGYCSIPIALEPYKIAIFTYPERRTAFMKRLHLKYREWYLRSFGWKVLKFPQENIQRDVNAVLQKVLVQVKIRNI